MSAVLGFGFATFRFAAVATAVCVALMRGLDEIILMPGTGPGTGMGSGAGLAGFGPLSTLLLPAEWLPPLSWLHGHCSPGGQLESAVRAEAARRGRPHLRAVLVATSFAGPLGWTRLPTGVWSEELTEAYYQFRDAGFEVAVATPRGGAVPFDWLSQTWLLRSRADARAAADADFQRLVQDSRTLCDVLQGVRNGTELPVSALFAAGGWGAGFDLKDAPCVADLVGHVHGAGGTVGGVCHGPLALVGAQDKRTGRPLLEGKLCTGVSNKQTIELAGVHFLTTHAPQDELERVGCDYSAAHHISDLFVTSLVEDDRIVTGQNQAATCHAAALMIEGIAQADKDPRLRK